MFISRERLQDLYDYDPETGHFTFKERDPSEFDNLKTWKSHCTRFVGKRAGAIRNRKDGYIFRWMRIGNKRPSEHRMAWLHYYGYPVPSVIDHINRDATDNRIANLRDGTVINDRNRWLSPHSTTGLCGVTWHKSAKRYQAAVKLNGKNHHLGLFEDKDEAFRAAKAFRDANGFDPTHGQPKEVSA